MRERERLLIEAPGLVEPLWFHMPLYKDRGPGRRKLGMGLSVYDLLSHKWRHKYYGADDFLSRVPHIRQDGLLGGYAFFDAQVDDARLVLRLISEALELGGHALNYTIASEILRDAAGAVVGVTIQDVETAEMKTLKTSAVVNATGTWAESSTRPRIQNSTCALCVAATLSFLTRYCHSTMLWDCFIR